MIVIVTISEVRGNSIVHLRQVLSGGEGVEPLAPQGIPGVQSDDALLPQARGNLTTPPKHPVPGNQSSNGNGNSNSEKRAVLVRSVLVPVFDLVCTSSGSAMRVPENTRTKNTSSNVVCRVVHVHSARVLANVTAVTP